jgi:hypothetical protein
MGVDALRDRLSGPHGRIGCNPAVARLGYEVGQPRKSHVLETVEKPCFRSPITNCSDEIVPACLKAVLMSQPAKDQDLGLIKVAENRVEMRALDNPIRDAGDIGVFFNDAVSIKELG